MPLAAGRGPYPGRTSSRVSFAMNASVRMYSPASGKVMFDDPKAGVKRDNEGARGRDMMPNLPGEESVMMDQQLSMIENTMMNTTDPISFDLGFEESIARVDEFNLIITDESVEQSPPDSPPSEDDRFLTSQHHAHLTHEQSIANLNTSNIAPTTLDDINSFSAPRASSASESTKVFVGNLAGDINEEELGRMFTQFGSVVEIVLHRRRSMLGSGSAFIRFAESHAAYASIDALNGSSKGRGRRSRLPLVVRIADPPKNNATSNSVAKAETNAQTVNVSNNKLANVTEFRLSATKTMSRGPLGTSTMCGQHIQASIHQEGLPTSKSLEYSNVLKQHNPYSFECYIEKEQWEAAEDKEEGSPITENSNPIMYVNRDEPELLEIEWAGQETDGSSSFDSLPSLDWVGVRGNTSGTVVGEPPMRASYNPSPSFRATPSPQPMARAPSPYATAPPPVLPPFTTPYVPASQTYVSLNTHRKYSSWQTPHPPAIPLRGGKAKGAGGLPMSSTAPVSLTNFEWPADADLLSMSPVGASLWEDMSQLLRPTTSIPPSHATLTNNNANSGSSLSSSLHAQRPTNAAARPSTQISLIGGDITKNASTSAPTLLRDTAARFSDHLPSSSQRLEGFHQPQFSSTSMTPTASGLGSDWVPHAEVPTSAGRWGVQWA